MATAPSFAATPNIGAATLGSAETSMATAAQSSTLITAGASGTQVTEIIINAIDTDLVIATVAGLVYVFLHDGSNYHLYGTITVTAVTSSTTVAPFRTSVRYDNLFIESGWSVRLSQSVAGNANLLKATVIAADF